MQKMLIMQAFSSKTGIDSQPWLMDLLYRLRAMQTGNAEARELARKLEQMEYQ